MVVKRNIAILAVSAALASTPFLASSASAAPTADFHCPTGHFCLYPGLQVGKPPVLQTSPANGDWSGSVASRSYENNTDSAVEVTWTAPWVDGKITRTDCVEPRSAGIEYARTTFKKVVWVDHC